MSDENELKKVILKELNWVKTNEDLENVLKKIRELTKEQS